MLEIYFIPSSISILINECFYECSLNSFKSHKPLCIGYNRHMHAMNPQTTLARVNSVALRRVWVCAWVYYMVGLVECLHAKDWEVRFCLYTETVYSYPMHIPEAGTTYQSKANVFTRSSIIALYWSHDRWKHTLISVIGNLMNMSASKQEQFSSYTSVS